jgi:ADP-ribose pyrophosphatase YjhB (NUDIX family)
MYPHQPLVGVAAVVWDGGRLVLVRRDKPPAEGVWSIPGGLIEIGETAEEALRREIWEECSLRITVGPILMLFQPIERDANRLVRYHFVVIDFFAHYVSGDLRSGDDAREARWVRPDELSAHELLPATRSVIAMALGRIANEGGAEALQGFPVGS